MTEDNEPPFVSNVRSIDFDASPTRNPRAPKSPKSATPKLDEFFRLVRERAMKNALPPRPDKRAEIESTLDGIEPERMANAFCELHHRLMAKRLEPGGFIAKAACDPPLFAAHAASLISQVEGMKLAEQSARPAAMPTGAELDAQRIAALAEMGVSAGEKRRPAI